MTAHQDPLGNAEKRAVDDDVLLAAEVRLARASDAWLTAQESFETIKTEYHAAFNEVVRLKAEAKLGRPITAHLYDGTSDGR